MIKIKKERVLLTPKDIKPTLKNLEVLGVFNPAAARLSNGDIILYARVWEKLIKDDEKDEDAEFFYSPRFIGKKDLKIKIDKFEKNLISDSSNLDFLFKDGTKRLTYISHLRKIILDSNGFKIKSIEKKPSFYGLTWDGELGIEDPRIVKIGDLYVMTYVSLSMKSNISTSYAISNDCIHWHRRGIIFREQNKDVVIFPEKVRGKYVAFDRPEGSFQFTPPHIWISYSKDLEFWGEPKPMFFSKKGEWDYTRIGSGPPPIKTDKGWLLIYHGVVNIKKHRIEEPILDKIKNFVKSFFHEENNIENVYCVGAALFDLKNPKKLISKTKYPIIIPRKSYEKGPWKNMRVVFPTGLVLDKDKRYILLYSGGGDRVITVKKIKLSEIFKKMEKN